MKRIRTLQYLLIVFLFVPFFETRAEDGDGPKKDHRGDNQKRTSDLIGTAAGVFLGFGSGHAIQDRWHKTGWVYSVVEGAGFLLILSAFGDCAPGNDGCNDRKRTSHQIGATLFFGGRIVEIVDVIYYTLKHDYLTEREKDRRWMVGINPGLNDSSGFVLGYKF